MRAREQREFPQREIFRGVTYRCERIDGGSEGNGWMHMVRVDLSAPGIGLYVTPVDVAVQTAGWQYRLRRAADVDRTERLAVTINASQFFSRIPWVYFEGDLASTSECVVVGHRVNKFGPHSYVLWFDDGLTPHLETTKPPPTVALERARWAVGGRYVLLENGRPNDFLHDVRRDSIDRRTAIGIDAGKKLLWLAVFERASHYLVAHTLAVHGAKDALMLDGGTSTAMVIGVGVDGLQPGAVFGGSRPQAIHFGVRAAAVAR